MTSAFIYSCSEMKRGCEGSDGRRGGRGGRQGLSNGEDTSNTSKKDRQRWGSREKGCPCSVVNVSCKLEQKCIMEA